jgi:exocyst complex component 4
LMWTLYARFEAIAESHRVVHDVVAGIVRRENRAASSATLTRGFKELWKLYQSEMRSLLHDYLATDGEASYRGGQGQASTSSAFSRAPRDRNKRMFKLSDVDTKATELSKEREDLEIILKTSVPGLVSDSKRPEDVNTNTTTNLDGSATGHKLLVEPSVFNMGILLPPSLDFLNRLKEVVPSNADISMSTLTSFLDDFLVNVFHPQLDETLIELCSQTFIEIDSFNEDPHWSRHSKKPIFKVRHALMVCASYTDLTRALRNSLPLSLLSARCWTTFPMIKLSLNSSSTKWTHTPKNVVAGTRLLLVDRSLRQAVVL